MRITKKEVEHICFLARLKLDDSQIKDMTKHLGNILGHIDKLKEVDIKSENQKNSFKKDTFENVLRQDEKKVSPGPDTTLYNAPKKDKDFFLVPRIVK